MTALDQFVFVERWTTRDALESHFGTEHLRAFRAVAKDCIASPTMVEVVAPQSVERP